MVDVFVTILIVQLALFFVAALFRSDKLTDLAYGLTFIGVAGWLYMVNPNVSIVRAVLLVMISLWGVRLAGYLFVRILMIKKDARFDGVRENWLKFLGFWLLQAVSIFVILSPTVIVLQKTEVTSMSYLSMAGFVVWLLGLTIEMVADRQKFIFKLDPKHRDMWASEGLWSRSRHPNYFGEMLVWWGTFLYCLPYLVGIEVVSIVSPLYITVLLLFVSGIPPLEKAYAKRYKGNVAYKKYVRNTPLLIPKLF